jgi:hypothetical protein
LPNADEVLSCPHSGKERREKDQLGNCLFADLVADHAAYCCAADRTQCAASADGMAGRTAKDCARAGADGIA